MDKVIFFDLYSTLLDVELSKDNPNKEIQGWDAFAKALEKYGKIISGSEFQKIYVARRDSFYMENNKAVFHHDLKEIITRILDIDLELRLSKNEVRGLIYEYRKASRGWLCLYPNVYNVLEKLSKEYILAIASHTQGSFAQIELNELDIEKFFNYFIYSSDIGFLKTSQEFYKTCLKIVNKHPGDCIVIGDNYSADVKIPQNLGIKAIWIRNPETYKQFADEKEPKYSLALSEFEKLPDLIERVFGE